MSPHPPSILLCPGQGAQQVGMGQAWAERSAPAAEPFQAADQALGYDLSTLCFEGPAEMLNRTDVAQPAIYATSIACYRGLAERGDLGRVEAAAGLSLGEFTALHLAGAFDFEQGLELVRVRGEAMQQAAEQGPASGMVALIGADEPQARELCEQATRGHEEAVLVPANFNCPGQVVVSGTSDACERATRIAERMELRSSPLTVAGAFHSPLMQPAADRLASALDEVAWHEPGVAVYSNVTGEPHDADDLASIKQRLVEQLTHPVRWAASMERLIADHPDPRLIELAPGKVLSGLMRRINRKIRVENHAQP